MDITLENQMNRLTGDHYEMVIEERGGEPTEGLLSNSAATDTVPPPSGCSTPPTGPKSSRRQQRHSSATNSGQHDLAMSGA